MLALVCFDPFTGNGEQVATFSLKQKVLAKATLATAKRHDEQKDWWLEVI